MIIYQRQGNSVELQRAERRIRVYRIMEKEKIKPGSGSVKEVFMRNNRLIGSVKKDYGRLLSMLILAAVILTAFSITCYAVTIPEGVASGNYLKEAMKAYNVPAERVVTARTPDTIKTSLQTAGRSASSDKMYIVYAPAGTYRMPVRLTVPANVIFVAESNSVFYPTTSDKFSQFFLVEGSLFGGRYECQNMAYYGLRLQNVRFTGNNGHISYATVRKSIKAGIVASGASCKRGYFEYNTAAECGNSGISILAGAWLHLAKGNTCSHNNPSGINLNHSNVNYMSFNTIIGNTGHGISTETDGSGQGYCHIHKITKNVIKQNGVSGVYLDENCYVDQSFFGNTISENTLHGLGIDAGSYVVALSKNTFSKNKGSNLRVTGKGSYVKTKGGNLFTGAVSNNITVVNQAKMYMTGSKNIIENSSANGIYIDNSSLFKTTGTTTTIRNNAAWGIRVKGNSRLILKKATKFSGNGSGSIEKLEGGTVKYLK